MTEKFNIEAYLKSRIDREEIDLQFKNLTQLPSLVNFKNLRKLDCSYNNLTSLSELPENLEELVCIENKLIVLPKLPRGLKVIWCGNNELVSLPELPKNLEELHCYYNNITVLPVLPKGLKQLNFGHNKITVLPELPRGLKQLICSGNNQLTYLPDLPESLKLFGYDNNHIYNIISSINFSEISEISLSKIKMQIRVLNRVRHLIYSLKCKKQLRTWLWMKVKLPKIQDKYHPDNLKELLDAVGDDDEDGFNKAIDTW